MKSLIHLSITNTYERDGIGRIELDKPLLDTNYD